MKHNYLPSSQQAAAPVMPRDPGQQAEDTKPLIEKAVTGLYCRILLLVLLLATLIPSRLTAQTYSGPIVITKGGTYSGNWQSTNSEVPAVEILTAEPVTIENSNIRGAGYLIKSWYQHANITVRNTNGYGIAPTPWQNYMKPRRFLILNDFKNVVVEFCYMENTAGIYIGDSYTGNNTTDNTVKIRYNKVKNIDGRVYGDTYRSQFVQFNFRNAVKHAEIAWNQVINEPNNSAVEDNINLFNAQGTSDSPIQVHNNFIKGAYPVPASGSYYTGGGIITDSDSNATVASAPRYIEAYENHLVNLGNYSMGIAGGTEIRYHHNRAVNSATFPDGSRFNMYTSGLWSKDYYATGATFNNLIDNNEVGITAWGYPNDRHDWNENQWATYENNIHMPGPITLQTEADEFTRWEQKLCQNGIVLGPNGSHNLPQACAGTGTGTITREYWANVHGSTLSDIPVGNTPSTSELTEFKAPSNVADNYGQRVRGYITAPMTGQYTFWIAADDKAALYLSTSEDPAQKAEIATAPDWSYSNEWTKYPAQQSAPITLQAGQRYYIEALHLEGGGGDCLAVGWQLPDATLERPIPGNRLSPFDDAPPVVTGKIYREYWSNVHGTSVEDVPVTTTPTTTLELSLFEAPENDGDNYGQRVRGYVHAPATGQYTFWIAADDKAKLYLSTSEDPAQKVEIASAPDYTYPKQWTKYPAQQSAPVTLQAGQRYYIEAIMLEGGGGDHLAVGWQLPDATLERPIPGNRLSPFDTGLSGSSTGAVMAEDQEPGIQAAIAYPNPFRDGISLHFRQEGVVLQQVTLHNQAGQIVYRAPTLELKNNKLDLDLSESKLAAGFYILRYTDSQGIGKSLKVIKL